MTQVGIVTIQPPTSPPFAAFTQRLHQLGYVEGQNLRLHFINPERQAGGNEGAVQELIHRKVDIILRELPAYDGSRFRRGAYHTCCDDRSRL